MIAAALVALALADAGLSGFRAAAGRNPLIYKAAYYKGAVLRGMGAGFGALVTIGLVTGAMIFVSSDAPAQYEMFVDGGRRMLGIYIPFATLVAAAFALYMIKSVELRSLLSTGIFGPVTLIRPIVILAGAAAAGTGSGLEVKLGAAVAAAAMLAVEPVVDRHYVNWMARAGRIAHRTRAPG